MIDPDSITDSDLQRAALNPGFTFKGKEIWPFHRAAKHVMSMLYTPGHDLFLFEYMALIWLLVKRGGATAAEDFKTILRQVDTDKEAVRMEIILWRNDLTDEDENELAVIARTMLGLVAASEPIIAPEVGGKKKEELSQPTSDIIVTYSENVTDGMTPQPSTETS